MSVFMLNIDSQIEDRLEGISETDARFAAHFSLSDETTYDAYNDVERVGVSSAGVFEEMESTVRFRPCT